VIRRGDYVTYTVTDQNGTSRIIAMVLRVNKKGIGLYFSPGRILYLHDRGGMPLAFPAIYSAARVISREEIERLTGVPVGYATYIAFPEGENNGNNN
jgi:hypothetical protein